MSGRPTPVQQVRTRTGTQELTPIPASTPGAVDYKGFRTNTQQTIANTGTVGIINWDEFINIGAGEDWPYDSSDGKVTLPPGIYQIVGGCTWSTLSVDQAYGIEHYNQDTGDGGFNTTGIFIGQQGRTPAAGTMTSPEQSMAGLDWYLYETEVQFRVWQRHATLARNCDRLHWGIWRLGDAPAYSCT